MSQLLKPSRTSKKLWQFWLCLFYIVSTLAKVTLMAEERGQQNLPMMAFIRVMYYFGYLPFSWVSQLDPEYLDIKFRISNWKTFILLTFDLLLALTVPLYFYLFNIVNVDPNFDPRQFLKPKYYIDMNDGLVTNALSQLIYVYTLAIGTWSFSYMGKSELNLLLCTTCSIKFEFFYN